MVVVVVKYFSSNNTAITRLFGSFYVKSILSSLGFLHWRAFLQRKSWFFCSLFQISSLMCAYTLLYLYICITYLFFQERLNHQLKHKNGRREDGRRWYVHHPVHSCMVREISQCGTNHTRKIHAWCRERHRNVVPTILKQHTESGCKAEHALKENPHVVHFRLCLSVCSLFVYRCCLL